MTFLYRFIRWLLFLLLPIFYPVKFIGRENIPKEGAFIICSNHLSFLDPVFLIRSVPRQVYFMAKEELFRSKFAQAFLTGIGTFAVRRGAGDHGAVDHAVDLIRQGKILGIYAEGTRSKDGTPKRAKSGVALIASRTGADVLPVAVCPKKGKVRMFRRTTVIFGQIIPNGELQISGTDRSEIRAATDKIMGEVVKLWQSQQAPENE